MFCVTLAILLLLQTHTDLCKILLGQTCTVHLEVWVGLRLDDVHTINKLHKLHLLHRVWVFVGTRKPKGQFCSV